MSVHAFLPPAGLSGTLSLLKGQQVTEDAIELEQFAKWKTLLPSTLSVPPLQWQQGVAQDVLKCSLLAQGSIQEGLHRSHRCGMEDL